MPADILHWPIPICQPWLNPWWSLKKSVHPWSQNLKVPGTFLSVMQQCLISTVMTIVYVLYKQGRLQVLWYDHEAWSTRSTACIWDSHLMTLSSCFETVGPFEHRHLIIRWGTVDSLGHLSNLWQIYLTRFIQGIPYAYSFHSQYALF